MRLRVIEQRFPGRIELVWHPFALRPEPNPTPFTFEGSYVERGWKNAALMTQQDGITYSMWDRGPLPRWSLPGLFAGQAARRQGAEAFARFHPAMFQGYFTRNEDITSPDVSVEIARRAGLDGERFRQDLTNPDLQQEVRQLVFESFTTHRITAVPTVVIGDQAPIPGAVPDSYYLRALADCGLEVGDTGTSVGKETLSTGWVDASDLPS